MTLPNIPAGWVLVPVEATEDMLFAAEQSKPRGYRDLYRAMLNAAPKAPAEETADSSDVHSSVSVSPPAAALGHASVDYARAADMLRSYVESIKEHGGAMLERWHYIPEVEEVADELATLAQDQAIDFHERFNTKPEDAATETPRPQAGRWHLIAPGGAIYFGESPIACLKVEIASRVPAHIALARIAEALNQPDAP